MSKEKKGGGFYGRKLEKQSVRRKGIHAKTKMSRNKNSKNYVKLSVGQG